MSPNFAEFGGVLQTGFAFNLGLSAFESVGNIFSLRFERRIEGLARCLFLVQGDAVKLAQFNAHLASARTRLQQAEDAVSSSSLFVVPVLLMAAALCAVFLVAGAWQPNDQISIFVGWLCVFVSFAPGLIALAANLRLWSQRSVGIKESIAGMFELVK
jgi:hypothetical protein